MRRIEILAVACIVALLGTSAVSLAMSSDGNESYVYVLEPDAKEDLINFVNEARDFV